MAPEIYAEGPIHPPRLTCTPLPFSSSTSGSGTIPSTARWRTRFHCWDIPGREKVYGETPVFVFDPQDVSNQFPQDPDYAIARERWAYCLENSGTPLSGPFQKDP